MKVKLFMLSLLILFAGCDSRSSGETSVSTSSVTGVFADDPVEGLTYVCSSGRAGSTNSLGQYTCNSGDTVTFSIGNVTLGTIKAQTTMVTPYDLFPNDVNAAVNIAQLLQSMDNNLSDNVITLDPDLIVILPIDTNFTSPTFTTKAQNDLNITLISKTQAQKVMNNFIISNGGSIDANLTIANIAPLATFTSFAQNEDVVVLGILTATDTDNDRLVFRIKSQPSNGTITLDGNGSFIYLPTANYFGADSFDYNVSDGVDSAVETVAITISNTPDAPIFTSATSVSVNENNTSALSLTATNSDGITTTYTLSGTDAVSFNIVDGVVTFKVAPDYETKAFYTFTATATAGSLSTTQTITITVADLPDIAPTLLASTLSISENTAIGAVVGTVTILDIGDSNITAFSISDTTNFSIDTSGQITTNSLFDYETTPSYFPTVYATNSAGNGVGVIITIDVTNVYEVTTIYTPTLVIVMNWDDYFETDAAEWNSKIFGSNDGQLNAWFTEATNTEYILVPATETQGTQNDGIIFVDMGKNHVGGADDTDFKYTEITNAISSAVVDNNINFASYDTDANGAISQDELQIVFLVSGGELSVGDSISSSIWGHAWSFSGSSSTFGGVTTYSGGVQLDGVELMNAVAHGGYMRFGANQGSHQATIGIIAHEFGHSLLNLSDFYDDGGGSGLGYYDIMSSGSYAKKSSDSFYGETPTQYTAFNKIAASLDLNLTVLTASDSLTISCSDRALIKLQTSITSEYFLLECRDTAKINSDRAFNGTDSTFGENRLFSVLYHIDEAKLTNNENGLQTSSNHYRVALVEKSTTTLMTSTSGLTASFNDVYTQGDIIGTSATNLYDGTSTNYSIEITNENYTDRTMTFSITK
ncbi:Probable RTX [hydrothermal vent metagenome]|uniref:Probable RTX n=1 Tax=hydrothermal vent metagenome TaxID=652676 RepID=A0A1W1CLG2_9ZZZZ